VLDFSGLAKLYGWKYVRAASEDELNALLQDEEKLSGQTVLELTLDPAVKPVTAARHF
jgi:2-succinyl-5-enolpyruvyl-6-hydroxy-3-cyclohexene-1-carboxylate synthase